MCKEAMDRENLAREQMDAHMQIDGEGAWMRWLSVMEERMDGNSTYRNNNATTVYIQKQQHMEREEEGPSMRGDILQSRRTPWQFVCSRCT